MSFYDFSQDVRGSRRRQSRLLVDDDFSSWSDVPRRSGRVGVTDVKTDRHEDRDYDARAYGDRDAYEDAYEEARAHAQRSARRRGGRVAETQAAEFHAADPYALDYDDAGFGATHIDADPDIRGDEELYVDAESGALELASPGRRTIVITGRGAERNLPVRRRRRESSLKVHERSGFRPDRVALWAFLLGLALLLGVTTSSHAAVLVAHHL